MFPECQKGVKTTIKDKENVLGKFRRNWSKNLFSVGESF